MVDGRVMKHDVDELTKDETNDRDGLCRTKAWTVGERALESTIDAWGMADGIFV